MKSYIKQGDCLELIKEIPDESIDMILCDLPYGETGNRWDKGLDLNELFKQYERVITQKGCIALFGSAKFGFSLYEAGRDLYKYDLIWQKENATNFLNSKYQPLRVHEHIFIFGKGATSSSKKESMTYNPQMLKGRPYATVSGSTNFAWHGETAGAETVNNGERYPRTIIRFQRDKEKIHPTQKPLGLCEWLIKTYSDFGDTVLDTCMGSGTTCVAAYNCGRKYIGFESNEEYYEAAKARIEKARTSIFTKPV